MSLKKSNWKNGTFADYLTAKEIEFLFFCYNEYVAEEVGKGNMPKEAPEFLSKNFIPEFEATIEMSKNGLIKSPEFAENLKKSQPMIELIIEKLKIVL